MSRISEIQSMYKELLIKSCQDITERPEFIINILDSILVFWKKHEAVINIFLKHQHEYYDIYFCTAADNLDIEDFEHYSFLAQGKVHIMDDPLIKMSDTTIKLHKQFDTQEMINNIKVLINDNIKILELEQSPILLLPIRSNNRTEESKEINSFAEQLFLNLFTDIKSIEEYKHKCRTVTDIKMQLRAESINSILLFYGDSFEEPFEVRMEKFMNYNLEVPFFKTFSNTKDYMSLFMYSMIGYLIQAIDIFLLSEEYKVVPYIRAKIPFYYYSLLCEQLERADKVLFKHAIYCHLIYLKFEKRFVKDISLKQYLEIISNIGLQPELIETMDSKMIRTLVDNNLKILYAEIGKRSD